MDNSSQPYTSPHSSTESSWLMAVTSSQEEPAPTTGSFHSRKTLIQPMERQDLMIRGYSQQEIKMAERTLQQRNPAPTFGDVSRFLDSNADTETTPLFDQIEKTIGGVKGVQGKAHLVHALKTYADSLEKNAVSELNKHYASLWPDKDKIKTIVERWPEALKEQANYINENWPHLVVNDDIDFDFNLTSKLCSNHYRFHCNPHNERGPEHIRLGYLAFFRLVKDIWFDAINTGNTCTMNRVSHLLIDFTKTITDNDYEHNGSDRTSRFEEVIKGELKEGISASHDIGAFAFLLVTSPLYWPECKEHTLKLMVRRAFNGKEGQLAPMYSQWKNPSSRDHTCKTVERELIPNVTTTMHFLHAIHNHLMTYRSQRDLDCGIIVKEISNGKYFDRTTYQLIEPIESPDWQTLPLLPEIKETLSKFFTDSRHKKLFLGTEEFKTFQKEQRRLKARQRFGDAINITIKQIKKEKAGPVKKEFNDQGFMAKKDNQGNLSYGRAYYQERKKYITHLKMQKQAVEHQIGVPIPFKATASQLNRTLDAFSELPKAEQRYWKMSRAYAESIAIPELLADLILTQESGPAETLADEHENLKEQQSKFITCRCSECTVCQTTRYLCKCPDGLNQKIAQRESQRRDGILKQRIIKSVQTYFSKNYCSERLPVLRERRQTVMALAQNQTQCLNKKKRTRLFDDRDKSTLAYSAKKPRFEHTLTDGSLCQKKHLPGSVIDRHQRQFMTEVLHKKLNSPARKQRNHQRSAEPAGQRKYEKVLRQLYKKRADNPSPRISPVKILDWFAKNPKQAASAIQDLQGKPQQLRSLFKPGTLEFATPRSLQAIPCQIVYHSIESFNKHLQSLATGKNNNFVPLDKRNVKGVYLHKTFCLACRTNFGQKRELQAHLTETHQAIMEKTFKSIQAMKPESTDEPPPITMPGSLFEHEKA